MRYRILDRESTILMFDREGTINPSSSLQVMRVGDRGMIHSLLGAGFYALLAESGLKPFRDLGLRYVYAAISDAHLALMRRRLPAGIALEIEGDCSIDGHALRWVLMTEAEAADAPA